MKQLENALVKLRTAALVFVLFLTIMATVDLGLDMVSEVEGGSITVDDSGGADHTSIQAAVDAAIPGDTVLVFNGIYHENVLINKTMTLVGEDRNATIINGTGAKAVVEVTADWVNLTGFSITNSSTDWDLAGVKLVSVENCKIMNNNIFSNGADGIRFHSSSNNHISNNNINSNGLDGIYFWVQSNDNTINGNTISYNNYGINILSDFMIPSNNHIIDNEIHNNTHRAIYLISSTHNDILNNNISTNGGGIYPWLGSGSNQIKGNKIERSGVAIFIDQSNLNPVSDNSIKDNGDGLSLTQAGSNDILSNVIHSNDGYAFSLWMSGINDIRYNVITYNNFGFDLSSSPENNIYGNVIIQNNFQAQDANDDNLWNDTYPGGGNYWSDYSGVDEYQGVNQDIPGSDGFGDTPYVIDFDSQDYYPLMEPPADMIFLRHGWNLISCPKVQSSTDIEDVLSQIDGSYSKVEWYNSWDDEDLWKDYNNHKPPELNELDSIDHTMGFWIFITDKDGVLFEFEGTPPSVNQTISLRKGWNMVGYPSLSRQNRTMGLNNLEFGEDVDAIQWFHSANKTWHFLEETDSFVMGRGYWIHATQDCTWEVPL